MKELSIEQKAKRYDEAFERVKELLSRCTDNRDRRTKVYRVEDIESIFPELKENEDEKIRKEIISHLQYLAQYCRESMPNVDNWIAWLEKQGKKTKPIEGFNTEFERQVSCLIASAMNKDYEYTKDFVKWTSDALLNYAKLEIEKNSMGISEATKKKLEDNLNKALEEETPESWNKFLDEQGEQKEYTFKSLPRLLDMIEPTDGAKAYCQKLIDTLIKEGYATDAKIVGECLKKMNGENVPLAIMDEKQGEQKPADKVEPKFKIGDKIQYSKGCGTIMAIEKIENGEYVFANNMGHTAIELGNKWHLVEQKPADKVEPKFKIGDFIVNDYCSGKVVKITDDAYLLDTGQGIPFSCEHNVHLWNVTKDAKEGDVLFHSDSASNGIFIFKEIIDKGFAKEIICYCDYDSEDHFCLGEHHTCCWADAKILHPATKEQRDTLEKAMTDAGYIFDFESKELKKLGQSEVTKMSDQEEIAEIPFGAKDSELQEATYFIPKGFHAEIDDDKVVIKKDEKPTAWSEEDEQITLSIEQVMNCASLLNIVPEKTDKIRTWLKSLKQRIGG